VVLAILAQSYEDETLFNAFCAKLFGEEHLIKLPQIKKEFIEALGSRMPFEYNSTALLKFLANTTFRQRLVAYIASHAENYINNAHISPFTTQGQLAKHLQEQGITDTQAESLEIFAVANFLSINISLKLKKDDEPQIYSPLATEAIDTITLQYLYGAVGHYMFYLDEETYEALMENEDPEDLSASPEVAKLSLIFAGLGKKPGPSHTPATTLELDGDDSSDEEETARATSYDLPKAWKKLTEDHKFKRMAETISIETLRKLFEQHVDGISRLYSPGVNKAYYHHYKPKLGKFEISKETRKEDLQTWLSETIKAKFAKQFFDKDKFEDIPHHSTLSEADRIIIAFVSELMSEPYKLRLFLKKIKLDSATKRLAQLVRAQNLEVISKYLIHIKKGEKIRKPDKATEQQLWHHIVVKSPIAVSDALSSSNQKDKSHHEKLAILRRALLHVSDIPEDNTAQLFILTIAAQLAKSRKDYSIYFEHNLPEFPAEFSNLASADGSNLALAIRSVNRLQKRHRRELENLRAIYPVLADDDVETAGKQKDEESGVLAAQSIEGFHFGMGKLYNRSSISAISLGRNEFVILGGTYSNIVKQINEIKNEGKNHVTDADIAIWISQMLRGEITADKPLFLRARNAQIGRLLEKALRIKELIAHMSFLLFFIEPMRNPAAFVFSEKSRYLVEKEVFTWADILGGDSPLHPMAYEDIVKNGRFFLNLFKPYLPYPAYEYEGEIKEDKIAIFAKKAEEINDLHRFIMESPQIAYSLIGKYDEYETPLKLYRNESLAPILSDIATSDEILDDDEIDQLEWAMVENAFDLPLAFRREFDLAEILEAIRQAQEEDEDDEILDLMCCVDVENWLWEKEWYFQDAERLVEFLVYNIANFGYKNIGELHEAFSFDGTFPFVNNSVDIWYEYLDETSSGPSSSSKTSSSRDSSDYEDEAEAGSWSPSP
jgi:hypothetical protein